MQTSLFLYETVFKNGKDVLFRYTFIPYYGSTHLMSIEQDEDDYDFIDTLLSCREEHLDLAQERENALSALDSATYVLNVHLKTPCRIEDKTQVARLIEASFAG